MGFSGVNSRSAHGVTLLLTVTDSCMQVGYATRLAVLPNLLGHQKAGLFPPSIQLDKRALSVHMSTFRVTLKAVRANQANSLVLLLLLNTAGSAAFVTSSTLHNYCSRQPIYPVCIDSVPWTARTKGRTGTNGGICNIKCKCPFEWTTTTQNCSQHRSRWPPT